MPRSGGVYSKPAGTTPAPGNTIESAKYNELMDDVVDDLNAARPITAGGTGATSASAALTALGGLSAASNATITGQYIFDSSVAVSANTAMTFGGVFSIVSDGTNTTLTETGAGNFRWRGQNITISNEDASETFIFMSQGGAIDLYFNNSRKFSTTNTGVQIVGEVDADSFTGTGFLDEDDMTSDAADKVASQQSIKAYVDTQVAAAPGIGVGQTWQDVSGSRAANTSYQNTTGAPIMVAVDWTSNQDFEVSTDGATWVALHTDLTYGGQYIIPNNHYYRVNAGGGSANSWVELR